MELVDILYPPLFQKSGKVKPLFQAWNDEDWIGTFNLWILQTDPVFSLIYQVRSNRSCWSPNRLDVTAGGHYKAGESLQDGLREVKEELGKEYSFKSVYFVGRKLHVSPDEKGRIRQNVVDICFTIDNSPLESFLLQKTEVSAVCVIPIEKLQKVHTQAKYSFSVVGMSSEKHKYKLTIKKESFPINWDDYHYKIALLSKRFLEGDKNVMY